MFELRGKYAEAKVFAETADEESVSQVIGVLNQPFSEGQRIRMMPDVHAGAGCTIGTTMTVSGRICPNLVGVDIGCGMLAVKLADREVDFAALDALVRERVPSGFAVREEPSRAAKAAGIGKLLSGLRRAGECDLARAERSIGTLGGGNHFIEVDEGSDGALWLVVHSGSRRLGLEVAAAHQKRAVAQRREASDGYVPRDLAWLEGAAMDDYVADMRIAQAFAAANRAAIAEELILGMGFEEADRFETIHNYLDADAMILRKGAVSAKAGERLLVPTNMRDGALLCVGKGNPDWNFSAPHGAGRLMSRSEAKRTLSLDEYRKTMDGVWTTSVGTSTIDESPMAYKPADEIRRAMADTAEVVDVLRPRYNFKAGL